MAPIDSSFESLKQIVSEIQGYSSSIRSEEDTRLKIINRILVDVLQYTFSDIATEQRSGIGYTDYQISINGISRLVIEAKKGNIDFDISDNYEGKHFNLDGPVFSSRIVKEGIHQTIYYASQESIELGCLTSGYTWIIFRANRMGDGKKVTTGKAVVFTSLDSILKNFKLFYELLYKENVSNLTYRAIFQEFEGSEIRTKDFAETLKNEDSLRLYVSDYSYDFERILTTFFSRLGGDDDPELLLNCFVESRESKAAEFQLARISEDLVAKIKAIETSEGQAIQKVIERIKLTNRQEFIILVGSKGAGKSTFIERFFNYVLSSHLKEECILVKLNLAKYKGSDSDIIDWIDRTLLDECENTLYDGSPTSEEIQGIFWGEYNRLRRAQNVLYETNKDQFKIEFAKHIEARRESRPTEYIQKLIGNIVNSRKKIPCIIFDNTDHFSIEIQEKIFQYGRAIYENEICLVIVPITDKTSWQLSKQGAIRSYENEVLFLPTPPPRKVIEKRIEYLNQKVEYEKKNKGQYFLQKGIQVELSDIERYVRYLQHVFLKDKIVSKWIAAFSNYDIRSSLELTKDIISSPHLSFSDFLTAYFSQNELERENALPIKLFKIKNAIIKRNYYCYPINHHPFIQNLYYATGNVNTSPILSTRILQVLMDRLTDRSSEDNFILVSQVLDYFNAMSIDRSITLKSLQFLLSKGLIFSYDPSISDIEFSKSVEISPSGKEHYFLSLSDFDYAYSMLEVTPITDSIFFRYLKENYHRDKLKCTSDFINYLITEDSKYCTIPSHISYKGQKSISTRYGVAIQIISRLQTRPRSDRRRK